ncbi:MAG: arginine repressor [Firmicutes bacterium]|nr:arginine repressor [Bacillota bacterium]
MKNERQIKILEIIKKENIYTQKMLEKRLEENGVYVTQATLSRDIRALNLKKRGENEGRFYYVAPEDGTDELDKRLERVFKNGIVSVESAENIIVIKTLNGMAMAVAAAVDNNKNYDIMGTIAGDDTVFAVSKTKEMAVKTAKKMKRDIGKDHA